MDAARVNPKVFWGKSDAGGVPHSLLGHLLDTAAVGELVWDRFMAPIFKRQVDQASGGRGRELFVALCATHDLGKATPAFQAKAQSLEPGLRESLLRPLGAADLPIPSGALTSDWPHPKGSVFILRDWLGAHGADTSCWSWVFPLIEGHHGKYGPPLKKLKRPEAHGKTSDRWGRAQQELVSVLAARCEIDPVSFQLQAPSTGVQLALGGFLVMADWIASSDQFPGQGQLDYSFAQARTRAEAAWRSLGLHSGWDPDALDADQLLFTRRFGFSPRPLQTKAMSAALTPSAAPEFVIIEAPMGEGKTEAALALAEILAKRHGCNGLLFAMPTQGTTDAMFSRVADWLVKVDPSFQPSLLHGKAMLNERWRRLREGGGFSGIDEDGCDEFGMPDDYGVGSVTQATTAPSCWLLGRHRSLLSPVAVGTIDQVLWAATRTRFVALRHAGLSGHVLVIDEVHSYDVYMSVFLEELLRWCARMGVPVVLMSATLAPSHRDRLATAWREGKGLARQQAPNPGYPGVLAYDASGRAQLESAPQQRADLSVEIEVLDAEVDDTQAIAHSVVRAIADGGVALVIMNTVGRAQEVWAALEADGVPTLLIHGRFTAAERALRTNRAIEMLAQSAPRPKRLAVVATQVAEQSFDVDADILFSDIAPVDLLLQRAGRLHRHARLETDRPELLRQPKLILTGVSPEDGTAVFSESFSSGDRPVYRRRALLATTALLTPRRAIKVPSEVPALVEAAYDGSTFPAWADEICQLKAEDDTEDRVRTATANTWRLGTFARADTLANLHHGSASNAEGGARAVVRDGDEMIETILIVHDGNQYRTLSGRPLGPNCERAHDLNIARELLGDTVRLRPMYSGKDAPHPLPEWLGHPTLSFMPVLVLNPQLEAVTGGLLYRYSKEVGLIRCSDQTHPRGAGTTSPLGDVTSLAQGDRQVAGDDLQPSSAVSMETISSRHHTLIK